MKKLKTFLINTSLCLFSILITSLVLEIGARLYFSYLDPATAAHIQEHQNAIARYNERGSIYQPHPYISYTPGDVAIGLDSCVINDQTFTIKKEPNTLRVACLGGSTTKNSYPRYLKKALAICFPDRSIEIMDWGCQGWTIVESTLNYVLRVQAFKPDIIILHHGINDVAPRIRRNFLLDYTHYRKAYSFYGLDWFDQMSGSSWLLAWLEFRLGRHCEDLDTWTVHQNMPLISLEEYPKPETLETYTNCLETITRVAEGDKSKVILAGMIYNVTQALIPEYAAIVEEHNNLTRSFSEHNNLLYIDTQSNFKHHPLYFADQCHLLSYPDEIKAFLLASAAARVMGRQPHAWVTDDLGSNVDLSLGKDLDPENKRQLVIHWNYPHSDINEYHVYIQVDGEKEEFLGRHTKRNQPYMIWESGNEFIAQGFQEGPLFGHTYRFSIYGLGGALYAPLLTVGPVEYEQESDSS